MSLTLQAFGDVRMGDRTSADLMDALSRFEHPDPTMVSAQAVRDSLPTEDLEALKRFPRGLTESENGALHYAGLIEVIKENGSTVAAFITQLGREVLVLTDVAPSKEQ